MIDPDSVKVRDTLDPRDKFETLIGMFFFWEMGGTPRGNPFILHREQIDLNASFISLSLSVSLTIFY